MPGSSPPSASWSPSPSPVPARDNRQAGPRHDNPGAVRATEGAGVSTPTNNPQKASHRSWIGTTLRDFPWVHLGLGLIGNTLFVVGSVMFFWDSVKTLAIWLFVLGSLGMLIGSVGELLVRVEKHRRGDG